MPQAHKGQILRFGVFEANIRARELRKHGTRLRLRGQPFCILSLLLERPGEIVTRDEMQQKLWPADTFVDFEHSLNSAIKKLRAALGDSPDNSRYIETIPRVGYRFVAPVQEVPLAGLPARDVPASSVDAQTPAAPRHSRWPRLVAGVLAVLVLATVGAFAWRRAHPRQGLAGEKVVLAVLPFSNLTGDPGQEYFSDGLTEEMIAQLGQMDPDRMSVIARTSVMHYKGNSEPLPQIGRELGVQYVLEGSVRRDSSRVRITVQLVRVKDQTPVWSREYDRELAGLLTLQHEVAQEVGDEMQVTLGEKPKPAAAVAAKPAPSPGSYAAYDLYLQGRYFWNKRTDQGFQRAADYFQQAIARDPNYARAYAGLADTDGLMSTWHMGPQNELMPKARAAALKALQLDDTLAEAHTSLALIAENYDYDWQTAEKEFKRAIQLDPGYATAHQWYAEYLSWMGRFDEALAESEKARQLDPLSMIIAADHATILYYARQYDRALAQSLTVLNMDPAAPRAASTVIYSYIRLHKFAEAQEFIQQHPAVVNQQWLPVEQAIIYGYAGRASEAQDAVTRMEQSPWEPEPRIVALLLVSSALGRKDQTIALLQQAVANHSNVVTAIKVDPMYDPLRSDPRFQELLRRVGLADEVTH
ncbi:MAG TPA: winged helix-turn-helix domain-containing protein [Candidatus Sulfotelmatobacter sp.]|nr:winged helix-turn-helix domain-containing protein [Candidatus Sulfotelmatobacter sp.]